MTGWVLLGVLLAALGGLPLVWVALWRKILSLPYSPDEQHTATTQDGWRLPLYRWLPESGVSPRSFPVVLCHGLGANRFNLDLDEEHSLARYLRRRGYDAWVVELRSATSPGVKAPSWWRRHRYHFDDLVDYDVPALLEAVCQKTGAAQVHWIGHSMGGMVMYAFLGQERSVVRSLTAVASPARFRKGYFAAARLAPLLHLVRRIPIAFLGGLIAPLAPAFSFVLAQQARVQNIRPDLARRLCAHLFSDMSAQLLLHFVRFLEAGCLCRANGDPTYNEGLSQATTPAFFLAAQKDRLAPPPAVLHAFEAWGGAKEYLLLSKKKGTNDYGHGDLLVGESAPTEVFVRIEEWLCRLDDDSASYDGAAPSQREQERALAKKD